MEQIEFKKYKHIIDKDYPACEYYEIDKNHSFYIEPNYYSQLKYLESRFAEEYSKILDEMIKNVMKNKKVIFTADFEHPVVYKDNFIYQEIEDITNPLNIFSGYISRGSDYGD